MGNRLRVNTLAGLLSPVLLWGLAACGSGDGRRAVESPPPAVPATTQGLEGRAPAHRPDHFSYSNTDQFRLTHVELNLTVDFETKTLGGQATLSLGRLDDQASTVVLDTRGLEIRRVALNLSGAKLRDLPWRLGESDPLLGTALLIDVSSVERPGRFAVTIDYSTDPGAQALQWMDPVVTGGGHSPFLYSLAESIHARSWIPVQDAPAVRMTYGARLRVPPGLTALMSARALSSDLKTGEFSFSMNQEIPAYLIAIAVGELEYRAFDVRSGVWAEPGVIDAAAREFDDTPAMIDSAEALFGPYRWEHYDLLILPPAFSVGGMENPRLSFITPTLIAGDKSLVSVAAHELAHSWSGNLVTNASWRHTWLNEGITSYLELRLTESLYGRAQREMEEVIGYRELLFEMSELPPEEQRLVQAGQPLDPDDTFNAVTYQKGAQFLVFLERTYGRQAFDMFLREYFAHFAFQSVTSEQFLDFFRAKLADSHPGRINTQQLDQWVYGPGLPWDFVAPVSPDLDRIQGELVRWFNGEQALESIPRQDWGSQQWKFMISQLPTVTDAGQLAVLDERFHLTDSENAIVLSVWLELAVRSGYRPAYRRLEPFLLQVGRSSLIRNVYRALAQTSPADLELGREIFRKASPGYHPTARPAIRALLYPDDGG
jgi:leukotriene-A4 hydrolase